MGSTADHYVGSMPDDATTDEGSPAAGDEGLWSIPSVRYLLASGVLSTRSSEWTSAT